MDKHQINKRLFDVEITGEVMPYFGTFFMCFDSFYFCSFYVLEIQIKYIIEKCIWLI